MGADSMPMTMAATQLYVNIGTGTVGFPARVGATPEITLFTLKKAKTYINGQRTRQCNYCRTRHPSA